MNNPRISLASDWDFQIDPDNRPDPAHIESWRTAVVPMPWQAQFDDLRDTSGVAWYRRTFTVNPDALVDDAVGAAILHFGAVDYQATVWLNSQLIGEHEGGYLPFEFDIFAALRADENELRVRVVDASDDRARYPDFPFSEVPHGKQSWYGPIGGIWQSVWLEFRPKLHITHITLDPSPGEAAIGVQVELNASQFSDVQILCRVTDPAGEPAGFGVIEQTLSGRVKLDAPPQLWDLESPNLYMVTTTLTVQGEPVHSVSKTCGFRTVEARAGRIYLNGEPVYLRSALDQAYYPETIYTPNSLELLERQARAAKDLGLNCLRIHIKIEDPRYYEVADRLGLLIWTEIPNWILLTDATSARAKATYNAMVRRDGHHPSIIAWTLINENWGTDLTRDPAHRQWLRDFYHEAKAIDPTRLIVDNSACIGNAHVTGDLEDFHYYQAIPDHAQGWDDWVADFAGRSDWAWYADYASERRTDLPLLVSEFGNWGLPDPAEIQEHGAEPWWFETGLDWGDGIVYPHGVERRFEASGLADLFPSYAEFARQSQMHMARSLHYEITSMRLHEAIAGYVVTEFTDVHWECNGLLNMQRKPKHMLDPLFRELNQDRIVLLRPAQWSARPGETVEVMVQTMGVTGQETHGVIRWQTGEQRGELPAPGETISLTLAAPGVITLVAQWIGEDGTQLAANQVDLVCVAAKPSATPLHVVDDAALATTLRDLGYVVTEGDVDNGATHAIIVAGRYTAALQTHLQNGGRLLLLADPGAVANADDESTVALPGGQIVPRAGTAWQGDWATSFAWLKKQGPFTDIPGEPLLEMEWAPIMPDAVITGPPLWYQREHSWAGLAVGWIHKTVSLLTVAAYGRGQMLVTTFKLNATTLATDAIAQTLFAGMLELL